MQSTNLHFACMVLLLGGLSHAATIVHWGSPGGETDIVTAQTNGSAMSLTYSETSAINPVQGTSYYPDAAGRNPVFYGSHSTYNNGTGSARWAEIHDSATTQDDIWINGYAEPLTNFQGMVTWLKADFLVPSDMIDSFTISIRKRNSTDTSTFRWLIKKDGQYYISTQTQSVSSTNFTNYSVDASSLTWKELTPFGWNGNTPGVATIGATVTMLTLDNVTAVGYYYDTTNGNTTTSRWCGSIVRHFQVNSISYKASLPSPSDGESVTAAPILSWTAGDFAEAHDVYFGIVNPPVAYMGRQTATSFNPNVNLTGGQYFWRIDEVKDSNIAVGDPANVWEGDVWNFIVSTTTNWTNSDSANNLWTSEANWDNGVPSVYSSANIHTDGPVLIDASVEAVATGNWNRYGIADTDPNADPTVLDMTGGSLTVNSLALGNGGPAIVNMSDGTITASGNLNLGDSDGGDTTFNINGGTVNIGNTVNSKTNATTNFINLNGGVLAASEIILNAGVDPNYLGTIINLAGGALVLDGDVINLIVTYVTDGRIIAYDDTSQVIVDYDDTNSGKTTLTGFKLDSEHADFNNDNYVDTDDLAMMAQEWLFQTPTQFAWSFDMAASPVGPGDFELEIREPAANNNHYIMGDDTGSGTLEVTGEGILLLDSHIPDAVGLFDTMIHYVVKTTSSNPLNLWYTMGTSANPGRQAYVGISTSLSGGFQSVEIWTGRPPEITGYVPVTVTGFSESDYLDITVDYDYETDSFDWTITDGTTTDSGTDVAYTYFNNGDGGEFTLQGKNGATGFVDQLDVIIDGAKIVNAVSDTQPDDSVDLKDLSVLAKEWRRDGYPAFSWDRVPLYAHFGISDGLSQQQYDFLAEHHFSLITITNGILRADITSEPGIGSAARAIKQSDPNTKVLFYWASDMPKHQQKLANSPFPEDGFLPGTNYFDVTRQDVRDWYSDMAAAAVQAYSCDGFFADGALRWFNKNNAEMDAGMMAMMHESKQKMGPDGIIIYNGLHVEGSEQYFQETDGAMIDNFLRSENINPMTKEKMAEEIEKMRQTSQDGEITVFKAWPGFCWWSDPNMMEQPHEVIHQAAKEYITLPLACFLVGAGENCYFGYSWGWLPEYGWFDWYPEFDKPLGPPQGDAIRDGWTYRREFEHASVFVDLENRSAQIDWR